MLHRLGNTAKTEDADIWSYIWGTPKFSASKAYKALNGTRNVHPAFSWLWKSSVQNKHKVFLWLLLKDRLSTRGLLHRRNMALDDYNCVLRTNSVEESRDHLFLHCPFVEQCWHLLHLHINNPGNPFQALLDFKNQLHVPFFMDVVIPMCWEIWMV